MSISKNLVYFNVLCAALVVSATFSYDLWQRNKIAAFVADSQRTNLFIRDFRALSSEVSAMKDIFYKIEVDTDASVVLYDASKVEPVLLSFKVTRTIFSDRNQSRELCTLTFYFDASEPLFTGLLIWLIASLIFTPIFRRRLLKLETDKVVAKELELERRFAGLAKQVAHDIRSPLSALRLAAGSLPADASAQAEVLKLAASRISKIADDLLKEDGKCRSIERRTLAEVAREVVAEKLLVLNDDRDIRIVSDFSGSATIVEGKDVEVSRVVSNLINNSVESLPGGGVIEVSVIDTGDFAELTVKDSGKGISPDLIKELGKRRISFGKDGSGLGLTHASEVARSLGGVLNISSEVGRGTQVTMRVPLIRKLTKSPASDDRSQA